MKNLVFPSILAIFGLMLIGGEGGSQTRGGKVTPALKERFLKEIWPLLHRGGKDGCVGCHHKLHMSTLRFSGKAEEDLSMLIRLEFFLLDDPGSLLNRVTAKGRRRMPPGPRPSWTPKEVGKLRKFTTDLQQR